MGSFLECALLSCVETKIKRCMQNGLYNKYIKRLLDIFISAVALIILAIPMGILVLLVKSKLGSPVIFSQERPGRIDPKTGKEKIFKLYKFRSMTDAKDENGNLLPDADRLPSFGKKLRSTSLDELPELWNILKGDMSIVGPRPLLVSYLPWYTNEERRRHLLRPGLTGWAQVNGRNSVEWEKRFQLDAYYVDNLSLELDLVIIFRTIQKVLSHSDIAEDTHKLEGNFAEIRSQKDKE